MSFSTPPRRQGFTLVELLVVIGIIAVLLSILIPALAGARRQSNDVVCQSNVRAIGQAVAMYAVDFKDRYPHTNYGTSTNPRFGALGNGLFRRGFNQPDPTDPTKRETTWGFPAAMQRLGYLKSTKTDSTVWNCPAAIEEVRGNGNSYRWYVSAPTKDGTSINRSRDGKFIAFIADNIELSPAAVDDPAANSSVLPRPAGAVLQYYPHYARYTLKMAPDQLGNIYQPWRDPKRGIPFLTALMVDGRVSKLSARQGGTPTTPNGVFGGFAPTAD